MYIYDRQLQGNEARLREDHDIVRPSQRFYYPARRPLQHLFSSPLGLTRQYSYRLGEAVATPKA
jgi:hypothetical protein